MSSTPDSPDTNRPNVLIIHTDQLRYDWLGCSGHPTVRTPNVDRLRAGGRMFTNHWVTNPVCQPSRGSLFTGLLPHTHGLWANGTSLPRREHTAQLNDLLVTEGNDSLTQQAPTLGDVFTTAGYRTAAMGKLHLQPHLHAPEPYHYESSGAWRNGTVTADWTGPFYGFQHAEFINGHHEKSQLTAGHYAAWMRDKAPDLVEKILADPPEHPHQIWPSPIPRELYHTNWLAERFDTWLGEEAGPTSGSPDQPFFTFIGFPGPHHPFAPSYDILPEFADWEDPGIHDPQAKFLQNSGYGRYVQEPEPPRIDFRDEPEILETARRHTAAMIWQIDLAVGRILDSLERRGLRDNTIILFTSDHGDFLGNHQMLFKHMGACRDLMNVPFLLSGPGIEPGSLDDEVMSSIDVLPTLAALAGVTAPEFCPGRDRSVPGSGEGHRAFGISYNSLISGSNHRLDNYSVMDGQYRATFYPRQNFSELYDYQADRWETRNLAEDPQHAERLRAFRTEVMEQLLLGDLPARERSMYF